MLALSPVTNKDESRSGGGASMAEETCEFTINPEEFPEFADHGNLLDSIDFDDLFGGMDGGDSLPDLEIDPEILTAEFSDQMNTSSTVTTEKMDGKESVYGKLGEEVVSKREEDNTSTTKKRKYSSSSSSNNNNNNNNQAKRKVKVDWTPELHRRFVQAVEQLGVDKAVPSRILELMNIDCLTRHNVASHLQKYRSHRKHLLAREAEAANWTRKRHMYGVEATTAGGRKNGWLAPTIGFPPPHFRPLHVWGHPSTVDQSTTVMPHVWPKHIPPPHSPSAVHPPFWTSVPPPEPPYWHRMPNGTTPGTPYFPATPTRFGAPPVAGIPPPSTMRHHTVHKSDPSFGHGVASPPLDLHPSKESVDAAIGEVLTKPGLPLPLGLKPPSVDSVMEELHRHGVSQVPPTAPCA